MEIHFKVTKAKEGNQNGEEISQKAVDLAERKIRNLKKYLGNIHDDLGINVYVELGKNTEAHQNGPMIWRANIDLDAPGEKFHATSIADKIEVAITTAVSEIEQELRKRKAQRKNVIRRGGTALKSLMRGFGT
jgi:ribosomal subunit interface protein